MWKIFTTISHSHLPFLEPITPTLSLIRSLAWNSKAVYTVLTFSISILMISHVCLTSNQHYLLTKLPLCSNIHNHKLYLRNQECLKLYSDWLKKWRIKVNSVKNSAIFLARKNFIPQINFLLSTWKTIIKNYKLVDVNGQLFNYRYSANPCCPVHRDFTGLHQMLNSIIIYGFRKTSQNMTKFRCIMYLILFVYYSL